MTATVLRSKPAKLGAEKLTPEEQRRRFEEAAREIGCDESEERFEAALKVLGQQKPKDSAPLPQKEPDKH